MSDEWITPCIADDDSSSKMRVKSSPTEIFCSLIRNGDVGRFKDLLLRVAKKNPKLIRSLYPLYFQLGKFLCDDQSLPFAFMGIYNFLLYLASLYYYDRGLYKKILDSFVVCDKLFEHDTLEKYSGWMDYLGWIARTYKDILENPQSIRGFILGISGVLDKYPLLGLLAIGIAIDIMFTSFGEYLTSLVDMPHWFLEKLLKTLEKVADTRSLHLNISRYLTKILILLAISDSYDLSRIIEKFLKYDWDLSIYNDVLLVVALQIMKGYGFDLASTILNEINIEDKSTQDAFPALNIFASAYWGFIKRNYAMAQKYLVAALRYEYRNYNSFYRGILLLVLAKIIPKLSEDTLDAKLIEPLFNIKTPYMDRPDFLTALLYMLDDKTVIKLADIIVTKVSKPAIFRAIILRLKDSTDARNRIISRFLEFARSYAMPLKRVLIIADILDALIDMGQVPKDIIDLFSNAMKDVEYLGTKYYRQLRRIVYKLLVASNDPQYIFLIDLLKEKTFCVVD